MANDRVFLKCKGCGAWKMLLKFFPGDLSPRDNKILEWAESHGQCHPRLLDADLGGDPGFTLHTESDIGVDLAFERQNADPPA